MSSVNVRPGQLAMSLQLLTAIERSVQEVIEIPLESRIFCIMRVLHVLKVCHQGGGEILRLTGH